MVKFFRKYGKHYLMLLPFFILFFVFFIYPIGYGVFTSFFKWDGIHEMEFIGMKNYRQVINGKDTIKAYTNLMKYVLITVPVGITISLLLAILVQSLSEKFRALFKSAYFLPYIIPMYLSASIWRWMFANDVGLINVFLMKLGADQISWLSKPKYMLIATLVVDMWTACGFNMIILIAGLNDIPQVYYDAAKVDGASKWQEIIYVTVPQVWPVLFFCLTYGFISALQVFENPWILSGSTYLQYGGTRGGFLYPVMDMMGRAFGSQKYGQAAAYGVILALVILVFTVFQFIFRRRVEKNM